MKKISILLTIVLISIQSILGQKYNAGFTSIKLVDKNRVYKLNTPESDSLHFRPIDLDIWYPSNKESSKPLLFGDLFALFEQRAVNYQDNADYSGLTAELALFYVSELGVGTDGQKLLDIKTDSHFNIEISQGKHPVVIYMAGFNGMGFENYKVIENLAQNGFVVLSIWSVGRYPGDMTNEKEDMMEQVYDAEFALRYITKNKKLNIDLNKVGILSCSWGGMSAAVFANRNPAIKAMVSYDGSETHYFGEADTNFYANRADGKDNDRFINEIVELNLLNPENQNVTYLYFESGDKLDEFTPTSEYNYYNQLKSKKYYLRFKNSTHADFVCIPSIMSSSENSIKIYKELEIATTSFFNKYLNGSTDFDNSWETLNSLDYTTDQTYNLSKNKLVTIKELNGQVIDKKTNLPLPYVNIGILNRETGTVTDTKGKFNLPINKDFIKDTLRISMIGYKPIEILIKNIESKNNKLSFKMEEQISELNEVVITAKASKKKTLGNKTESKFIGTGFAYNQLGAEMGIKINIRKNPTIVEAFNFSISYNRLSAKSIFRLNFYSVKQGKPFENLMTKNILIPIESKQTGLVTVNLKPYDIVLYDDIIATLEWVDNEGENNKGEGIFFPLGLFTSGTLHKESSQASFRKLSSLGVGFNIDVRY